MTKSSKELCDAVAQLGYDNIPVVCSGGKFKPAKIVKWVSIINANKIQDNFLYSNWFDRNACRQRKFHPANVMLGQNSHEGAIFKRVFYDFPKSGLLDKIDLGVLHSIIGVS